MPRGPGPNDRTVTAMGSVQEGVEGGGAKRFQRECNRRGNVVRGMKQRKPTWSKTGANVAVLIPGGFLMSFDM